jgi:hypothetical protein
MKTQFLFPFLFYISLFIINLQADVQTVYNTASKTVVKITALDEVNNVIRYSYGVPVGKSKCIDTAIRSSLENSGFENSNKFGTDILTTFQAVLSASRILVENKNGEKIEAAVVYINSEKNIALLRTKTLFLGADVSLSNKFSVGNKVFIYNIENVSGEKLHESFISEIKLEIKNKNWSAINNNYTNRLVSIFHNNIETQSGLVVFDENGFFIGFYKGKNTSNKNNLVVMDVENSELINKAKSFNIVHPGEVGMYNWSIGIYYYEKYDGDIGKSLIWRDANEKWIQWRNIDDALIVIDRVRFDKRFIKTKGTATKSFPYDFLADTKEILSRQRLEDFEYSVEDDLVVNFYSGENNKSIESIDKIINKYGRTLYLSEIYFETLFKLTPKQNINIFKDKVLEYLKNCPKKDESIPYGIKQDILRFKSSIASLPSDNYDESESTKKYIGEIIAYLEKLGWKD